jgi:propionate CoA-transferase
MKIISADAASRLIEDGWTVSTAGFTGSGHAEAVSAAIEKRFLETGRPRDLTLLYAAGQGDRISKGTGRYGHRGLIKRVIGGHWGAAPRLGALAVANEIEAHNWPQGVIAQLYRAIAGKKPGVITAIGLHTFVDPRYDGGRLNARTTESLVELVSLGGREWLFYPSLPIQCAVIRGTTADEKGNITMEHEAFHQDVLPLAQAAHNSGGIVIVQVKRLAQAGTLNPNLVRVPGILVDYVVVCENPDDHWMTYLEQHNPAYCGEAREAAHQFKPLPLDVRKVIQRRAFFELQKLTSPVANLGVGIPAGVGQVACEEGHTDFTLTVESGPIGGIPAQDRSFGAATNPEAIIDHAAQFDFYDGGGLDISFLGLAQLDAHGNINVSRFGNKVAGIGGFVNISQTAKNLVFMGTMTTQGLEVKIGDGWLSVAREGAVKKIIPQVEHLSFNGPYVASLGIGVVYVTERAVFRLRHGRLTVTEVAPGIDLGRDVLEQCATPIAIGEDLHLMDARIFRDQRMGASPISESAE